MHAMILDENRNFKWAEMPDPVRKTGHSTLPKGSEWKQ